MPSSSSQQDPPSGLQIDAAVAAASYATSTILTRDAKVHTVIGGYALRLLGNKRRTKVCIEAHQIVISVTDCCRT